MATEPSKFKNYRIRP